MNPHEARTVLDEGLFLLSELGVTHWLSAGTALGLYRDDLSDEFLLKDTDIDVGVLGDGRYFEILNKFEENGFQRFRSYKTNGMWSQLALVKNDIIFDIYFFVQDGEELVNHNEHGVMRKPFFKVGLHKGYPMFVPCEAYLEVRYGKGWRIPSKEKVAWQSEAANLVSR